MGRLKLFRRPTIILNDGLKNVSAATHSAGIVISIHVAASTQKPKAA